MSERKRAPFLIDGYAPLDGDLVYFGAVDYRGGGPFPCNLGLVAYNGESDFWAIHSVTSAVAWKLSPDRCREVMKRAANGR